MDSKNTEVKDVEEVVQFSNVIGTPTILLLPARNYKFKVFEEKFVVTLPRKGKYTDFDNEIFSEDDGEFNFLQYDNSKRHHVMFLPALSKILFATNQYPDLEDNQAFTPIAFVVKKDKVEIIGNIIEMVKED